MTSVFDSVLSPDQITSSDADLAYYGGDAGHHFDPRPSAILFPKTVAQVQQCIKIAAAEGIPLVPSGGRSGYAGGATATAGEAVLSLEKMNRVLDVSVTQGTIRVEAGVTLERVQQVAEEAGLYYPVDFTARGSAQIGGTVATNAGGVRVIRYGMTREWVLALQVVTGTGNVLNLNGPLYKNNSGYNLLQFMCGSEGTLGIITEVTLKLTSPLKSRQIVCLSIADEAQILPVLEAARAAQFEITLFEFMDRKSIEVVTAKHNLTPPFSSLDTGALLLEIEEVPQDVLESFVMRLIEEEYVTDAVLAENSAQAAKLLQIRELIGDVLNKHFTVHKEDVSFPITMLPDAIKGVRQLFAENQPAHEIAIFGHAGDGNLHINVIKADAETKAEFFSHCDVLDLSLYELVDKLHGSVSAEHGVGLVKKSSVAKYKNPAEFELYRAIKRAFDPANVLNRGKVIDL